VYGLQPNLSLGGRFLWHPGLLLLSVSHDLLIIGFELSSAGRLDDHQLSLVDRVGASGTRDQRPIRLGPPPTLVSQPHMRNGIHWLLFTR